MTPRTFKDNTGLLLAILVSSFLLLADLVGLLGWFKSARAYVLYPVKMVGSVIVQNTRNTALSVINGKSLRQENLSLRQRVLELESLVDALEQTQLKQADFAAFQKYAGSNNYKKSLTAHVIDFHNDSLQGKLLLDKGTIAGAKVGMPVVLGSFYIGYISVVTPFESTCISFLLPNQEFVGYIQKRRITGIVKAGINGMELSDLLASEKVALHDVVTMKRDNFPYFFILGTIFRTPLNNGSAERTAAIASSISIQDLSFVTIVQE